ncbi:MAG: GLUG motif-containing protein, partial [Sulfuricurvum sp.]|nr:GLUG motif-containing protein [Sulfuricurvum sp.]
MKPTYNYRNAFRILKGGKISLVVAVVVIGSTILSASPSGGSVTSGTTTITQIGSVININQTSQKTTINWQDFSIAKNETVNFIQPNANAIALNRVVGNEKSIIDGTLNANGQVWILNSNGVLFNSNASINTAGLLATTKTLSDTDFNADSYTFKGDSTASVINMGTISISDGGYTALLANSISNQGTITALRGTVELIGANEATINLNGNSMLNLKVTKGVLNALVENKGAILAEGGQIYLTTNAMGELLKGVVNNTGVLEANSLDDVDGHIEMFAHGGTTNVSGSLNALGGSIETSGEYLSVSTDTRIKAKEWLLDPTDITIESTGGTNLAGSSISAGIIDTTLNNGTNVTLSADNNIYVNQALTWSAPTKLTLSAGNQINVNAVIENTNTTNGGVYFQAANITDAVAFGTSGKVVINNAYQLQWMNTALGGTYTLGSNIDASGTSSWNSGAGFVPIGDYYTNYFTGTLDGLGHTISGLTIYLPEQWYVGLFGAIKDNALIQNIGLVNETITGNLEVGGLVGENEATVINAYTTGSIFGNAGVGGLVGRNYYSSITDSHSTASVTGIPDSSRNNSSSIAGLVGVNFGGSITDSYATGSVIGNAWIGGLVGYNLGTATITNSYATGSVSVAAVSDRVGTYINGDIGGLVGNNTGTITNSYATGDVTGYLAATGQSGEGFDGADVGGLAGINVGTIINSYATGDVIGRNCIGGLVGENYFGIITNSYATGNVTGSAYFGGFIGANEGSVTDSYSTGNVTLSAIGDPYVLFPLGAGSSGYISGYLGGFVGKNSGTITNSYATGSVTGSNYVGGFVGYNYTGTITNAYWDKDTSGQSSAIGGNYGGTTTNLVGINSSTGTINTFTQATYTGFDFANTWVIYEGYTRPLLRSFMTALTVTANDVAKTYDTTTYSGGNGVTYSIATPDSLLLLGSLSYTNTGDTRNVGTSFITTEGLYSSQQGYLISYASGTLSITPKSLIVTATADDKTYDATTA